MTEQEYNDVHNLAQLRAAVGIARDCLAVREEEEVFRQEITVAIIKWIDYLEAIVSYTPDDDTGKS